MSYSPFPAGITDADAPKNPAIQMFGNRLFREQSPMELLIELLLVADSPKRIADTGVGFTTPLPEMAVLAGWQEGRLEYAPKARLNLKLFAFMGASRLDSRHETHRQHYRELLQGLQTRVRVVESGGEDDALRTLENLFLGFQGTGSGRTWCAQNFLPVCPGFLAGESIWGETAARRDPPDDWARVRDRAHRYFDMSRHRFLARGGEVLYLQMCNALRQGPDTIRAWVREGDIAIETEEQGPAWLLAELQRQLRGLMGHCPQTVTDIAEFIDSGVEADTAEATDRPGGEQRFVRAGWCPADSWREGYLFAVDVLRLCQADLDVIERLRLLETACAMQVLRSLGARSARARPPERAATWPGYRIAVSAPDGKHMATKRISQHTVKAIEKLVYRAIRSSAVALPDSEQERDKALREADTRYAGKLFIGMAKRIGLLVPRRGAGARFTLNEQLLRYLVVTTVPVGGRLTYDSFKSLVEARHGLVFDGPGLVRASAWADGTGSVHLGDRCDAWLQQMLEAAGLLVQLSDSCALVRNPAARS